MPIGNDLAGRAKRLRDATADLHAEVDEAVMAGAAFESRLAYVRFLTFQYHLHRIVEPLYADRDLRRLVPDLGERSRIAAVVQDFRDLELEVPANGLGGAALAVPEALGWLYVVEGSRMGAAVLLKAAEAIGLSEMFGARHLAGHPQGRGLHWRRFTAALDAVALSDEDDKRVVEGARAAFGCTLDLIRQDMG